MPPIPPTRHMVRAALQVAAVVGVGSTTDDAVESYWQRATGGVFPPGDLSAAQQLLLSLGLLLERDGRLLPAVELTQLL